MSLERLPTELDAYFRLIWLFVGVMFSLMGLLCYLYLAMRGAQERETESLNFSRLVVTGQETERRRIACELHDTVLPEVRLLTGSRGEAAEAGTILRQQAILSDRIRELCGRLMPPDFTKLSLRDALIGLCASFAGRMGIECLPAIETALDFGKLSPDHQLHLYRMVQEAFTNIEKHAHARRVTLVARLKKQSSSKNILICVSDDGAGLPPENTAATPGLGMMSMRKRASILGARLDFINESGNGLMVRIEIPISPPPPPIDEMIHLM
jgi:two-component system NarL family sensor kinase